MDFWVMTDDMKAYIKKERDYLLGINDYDALKLSPAERYQRDKYKGEIESAKWLEEIQRKAALQRPKETPKKAKWRKDKQNYQLGD